jgi:hypothetical protein
MSAHLSWANAPTDVLASCKSLWFYQPGCGPIEPAAISSSKVLSLIPSMSLLTGNSSDLHHEYRWSAYWPVKPTTNARRSRAVTRGPRRSSSALRALPGIDHPARRQTTPNGDRRLAVRGGQLDHSLPSGTSVMSSTSSAISSERRNAPANPRASSARSRRPVSVSEDAWRSISVSTSAMAGAFCARGAERAAGAMERGSNQLAAGGRLGDAGELVGVADGGDGGPDSSEPTGSDGQNASRPLGQEALLARLNCPPSSTTAPGRWIPRSCSAGPKLRTRYGGA